MASVVAVCLQVAPSDGVLTDETTIRLKQTITPKQKRNDEDDKKSLYASCHQGGGCLDTDHAGHLVTGGDAGRAKEGYGLGQQPQEQC